MTPQFRAVLAIIALFLIAICSNWLMRLTTIGNKSIDLTENQVHTLSEGTHSILKNLDAPVTIRYYASRGSEHMPRNAKLYMKKVDALLKDYQRSAENGLLRIEHLDPRPDTDAEDAAILDGISGQRITEGSYEENVFLGLSISCLDQKTSLPFLDPANETMLEYELSRAISNVARADKPVLGMISALPLAGSPANPMTRQPATQPWIIYRLLQQNYQVRDLGLNPQSIDPEEISAVLLIHPAGLTPQTEYAIDQYLLRGGRLIACLDPYCLSAETSATSPLMMNMLQNQSDSSTLPTLLPQWGITFHLNQYLSDPTYATPMPNGAPNPSYLNLPEDSFRSPSSESQEAITQGLTNLFFIVSGAFFQTNQSGQTGLQYAPLILSSAQSGLLPVAPLKDAPERQALAATKISNPQPHTLALRLTGVFRSAFPDGKPVEKPPSTNTKDTFQKDPTSSSSDLAHPHLTQGTKKAAVLLLADVDFLNDQACYVSQDFGGQLLLQPVTGNSALFFNSIDQFIGSSHLIGARSRSASRRPFTKIQAMESAHQDDVGAQIQELEQQRQEAMAKLQALQAQKSDSSQLVLSPEQEAEINRLEQQQVTASQAIRSKQKRHKKEHNRLVSKIVLLNLGVTPLVVIILGLCVHCSRRVLGRAR